ncbi:AMP-binding protein [Streptodolium elevatio]|uniref:AMP-binding protein n=1 Tax=Streptodolium elevatio TaxID=3157996 RepID=A0ABV3DBM2_9ACTN
MANHPEVVAAAHGQWGDETLDCLLRDRVALHPDDPAVADPPDIHLLTGRGPEEWTWSRLDQEVDRLAALMLGHGVGRGDTVAIQLPAGVELVQAGLACWRIGATAMPLAVSLRDRTMTYRARRGGARTIVTSTRIGGYRAAAVAVALPCFPTVLAWGPEVPDGAVDLDSAVPAPDEPAAYLARERVRAEDRAALLWTACDGEIPYRHRDLRDAGAEVTGDTLTNAPGPTCPTDFPEVVVPWLRSGCRLVHPETQRPAAVRPQPVRSEQVRSEAARSETARSESLRARTHRPEAGTAGLTGSGRTPRP